MLDKISFTFTGQIDFINFLEDYCSYKNVFFKYGSGYAYHFEKGFFSDLFQVFYTEQEDNNIVGFAFIGSELSNKFGLYLLKHLIEYFGLYGVKIRRLDFCYDFIGYKGKKFNITEIEVLKKPSASKPQKTIFYNKNNERYIDTSYLITKSFKIRCYDKGVEQGLCDYNSDWKRFEIQFNKDFIDLYIKEPIDLKKHNINYYIELFKSLLFKFTQLYSLNRKYQTILKSMIKYSKPLERIKREEKNLSQKMAWFEKQFGAYFDYYFIHREDYYKKLLSDDELRKKAVERFMEKFIERS